MLDMDNKVSFCHPIFMIWNDATKVLGELKVLLVLFPLRWCSIFQNSVEQEVDPLVDGNYQFDGAIPCG